MVFREIGRSLNWELEESQPTTDKVGTELQEHLEAQAEYTYHLRSRVFGVSSLTLELKQE